MKKKTPEHHLVLSSQSSQNVSNDDKKRARASLKYFKSLVKKFSLVFAIFSSSKRKSTAEVSESNVRRNRSRTRLVSSCKSLVGL